MFSPYIRRLWKDQSKKDLREVIRKKYGEAFAHKYDLVNLGIPIGDVDETMEFLIKVNECRKEVQE
jgi:hypothetical protein